MSTGIVQHAPIEIVDPNDGFTLRLARRPEALVAEATLCANALMAAVRKNNWAQKFGNKEHLFFEAWAFLATMYRVTPRVKETRLVQIGDVTGYEAFAEAFHVPSGIVISTADSMCLDDEDNWDMRNEYEWKNQKRVVVGQKPVPLFQLRSMAQTRAMAKALRGPFSWVVAMAGFAATPANEMTGSEPQGDGRPAVQQPQQKADGNGGATLISEAQGKRLWAIARTARVEPGDLSDILKGFGFAKSEDVTRDKYEAVCLAVEKAGAQGSLGGNQ